MERKLAQRKTYWDKYPELKFLKNVSKRVGFFKNFNSSKFSYFQTMISFMFFSYMFLFSTAEYAQIMNFVSDSDMGWLEVNASFLFRASDVWLLK